MPEVDHKPTYRAFIAIEIPPEIRRLVREHTEQLRATVPNMRASWSREHNLHLTLKFLGNTPVETIPEISKAVETAGQRVQPFRLELSGCGAFPAQGKPKVLWIGISDTSGSLAGLQAEIESACGALGLEREARDYHPHLTIARLRDRRGASQLGVAHQELPFPAQAFTVSELVVFKSQLLMEGSKHTALSRHQLGAKDSL